MAVSLRALLPVLVFAILLLHLLSLGLYFRRRSGDRRFLMIRLAVSIVLIPILLSAMFALSNTESAMKKNTEILSKKDSSISELEELTLKISRMESILEDNTEILNSKMLHLGEKDKMIEDLGHKIESLQGSLHHLKLQKFPGGSVYTKERVDFIKQELQDLWAESRKNNFNLHILESKAYDAEERLESVSSQVEKMEDIVTEQWIHIQKLEQALQVTKLRTSKAHRKSKFTKCTFFKFINDVHRHRLPKVISFFKRILSGAQRCHHELQVSVKEAMERNELTAALANNEIIFFLASAMITFPIMSIWIIYSSYFCL